MRSTIKVSVVPTINAVPIATGKATASPAIEIAATSRIFARLKTTILRREIRHVAGHGVILKMPDRN
ncbi:MAG: hypothetical protein ACLPV8_28335, partial [Steroidobacteraceae bacterium]